MSSLLFILDEDNNTAKLLGISSLAELSNETEENFSDSDDSEKEDDLIKPTDNLILVGHVEGDASILEVHGMTKLKQYLIIKINTSCLYFLVYNEEDESLYVHHDIFLPSFPLCLEWLNYEPKMPKGSYCAIGTMSPIIEVWDLDLVNSVEPSFRLGQLANRKKQKSQIGHKDAVLALAWNKNFDHVMASGSVDKTILLWDMENKKPNTTISSFDDKVQCLEWHRLEAQTLLAGSFLLIKYCTLILYVIKTFIGGCDNKARIFDCRSTETHQTWSLNGEAERLLWHPLKPFSFIAGTSNGTVQCFDCRQGQIWEIQAHEKEVTGLAVSSQCPGLLLTASTDELVKIWDCQEESTPVIVTEINFGIGQVHCLELCPDSPFVITAGGDKKSNNFTVYDLRNNDVGTIYYF